MNCEQHFQPILGYSKKDQLRRGLCSICLAQQVDDFMFTEVANYQIIQFIRWFSDQFENLYQNYSENLMSCIQQIHEMKSYINQQIDKLINKIQDWVTAGKEFHKKSLKEIKNLNFNEFVQQVNEEWKNQEKQFKTLIFGQISHQSQKQWKRNCLKALGDIKKISLQLCNYEQKPYEQINLIDLQSQFTQLNLKCEQDNQYIIMMDINQNTSAKKRLVCVDCISRENGKYITFKDGRNLWQQHEKMKESQLKIYSDKQQVLLSQAKTLLQQLKYDFVSTIENFISNIDSQHSDIIKIINKEKLLIPNDWYNLSKRDLQKIAEILSCLKTEKQIEFEIFNSCNKQQVKIQQLWNDTMIKLQKSQQTNLKKIMQLFQQSSSSQQSKNDNSQQIFKAKEQMILNDANCRFLDQYSIQQNEWCNCLCFNKDNNILAVGCGSDIKIFKFENGKLTQIQLLEGHAQFIRALHIGNTNQIFSCSNDNTIIIWVQQIGLEWQLFQQLQNHRGEVWCIAVNKAENQFITGCADHLIKSWSKISDKWKCVQTLKYHQANVIALSLNESDDQLLSCGEDKKLNIFKYDSKNQWQLIQTLITHEYICRASFIGDDMIISQLINNGTLKIYEKNQAKFLEKQDFELKGTGRCFYFFPQVFCKQQSLLVNKNCQFINVIKINQNNQLILQYAIEFKTRELYGTITNDSDNYLVTWDYHSKQIQVRLLK